jgi:hypothetical protein
MRIYIDEAGPFLPPSPPRSLFSLVLALVIPNAIEQDLLYEFLRLRDTWPNQNVEIKGSSLDESQSAQLINLVLRYDVIVEFIALNTNTHPDPVVECFKNRQADAVTANITREHEPGPIPHYYQLGESVRAMPNQLFLQAMATWELVIRTVREATVYYVQRQPVELGDISWVIDRKDRTITEMEETWSTLVLPLSETAFVRKPLLCIQGEDYSHFESRYGPTGSMADPEMLRHREWLSSVSEKPLDSVAIDATLLLTQQRTFEDSRNSLGLQLCDMLAAILRRALNDRLQIPGWKNFGGLLIRHRNPGEGFVQLGLLPGGDNRMPSHTAKVCRLLDKRAKSMIAKRNQR